MQFNSKYAGHIYQLVNGEVYTQRADGAFVYVSAQLDGTASSGIAKVVLTGYSATTPKGATAMQTTNGNYIFLDDGWADMGTTYLSQYSQTQAQALVDKIIKNNKTIIQNNILCARYASKLSASEKQTLYELQERLQDRNTSLQTAGVCSNVQTSYPRGYAYLEGYLDSFMASGGVGLSTAVIIVISAVVIASLSTAAYFAYKAFADQSEKDVKFSKELTATLTSKLTEEEYQQLVTETKGIVTKARIKQSLSSSSNLLMLGLAATGGYFIYQYFKSNGNNKKKK